MYLPPLQPVTNSDIRICGDVEIHPTASIAPGVILQAAPNSRIVIGVDVCLGMGVIISAYGGTVEIADGATLGSGVLIVGNSQVGSNACIGTATTVVEGIIEAMAVIKPGSLIDNSIQTTAHSTQTETSQTVAEDSETANDSVETITDSVETVKPVVNKVENKNLDLNGNGYYFAKAIANSSQEPHTNTQATASDPNSTAVSSPDTDSDFNSSSKGDRQELSKATSTSNNPDILDIKQATINNVVNDNSGDPWIEEKSATIENEIISDITIRDTVKNEKNEEAKANGKVYIDRLLVTLFPHRNQFNDNSRSKDI